MVVTSATTSVLGAEQRMTMPKDKPTVVLADDHMGILNRVSEVLAQEYNVVAMVNNGADAVKAVTEFAPDVLILDITMPGMDGIKAGREIKRLGLTSKLIFLSVREDADYIEAARAIGASYVLKPRLHVDLTLALKETLAGRIFISSFSDHFVS